MAHSDYSNRKPVAGAVLQPLVVVLVVDDIGVEGVDLLHLLDQLGRASPLNLVIRLLEKCHHHL